MITARPAHLTILVSIHAAAFAPDEAWSADSFRALLALPTTIALLDPIGGLVLVQLAVDEAEILTLAVHPVTRRQGVGRGLLAAAITQAAGRGALSMFLDVSERNQPARALYAAAGFTQAGRRQRYYPDGSDALLLRRGITSAAATIC